ncbi:MAG: hypothetical protein UZ22_OP11002000458 [Microgenomates bacterium OLB23]|nr:MAG: hypothetical protein UZ22_OP11002000458 [Microgenomates bacterium OLB23]
MYNYCMLPFAGPDIEQAIRHTFTLTLLHNAYPMVLFLGIVVSISYALYKPSRGSILLFIGLTLLLLHFEYQKHIVSPLLLQTQVTLATETPRYKFIWLTEKFITKIIPFLLLAGGGSSTLVAALILRRNRQKTIL